MQLAHIARPVIGAQSLQKFRRHALRGVGAALVQPAQKILGIERKILRPLPQGRDVQLETAQAEIHVPAKAVPLDKSTQLLAGGGDDADVELDGLRAAEALDAVGFHRPQELLLHLQRHVGDLVEKQRAVVCQLKAAGLALRGSAGEGAGLIAEELHFEKLARNGRAVDHDKGPVGVPACVVDRLGQHLLAAPALALDQDIALIAGKLCRQGQGLFHAVVFGENAAEGENGAVAGELVDRADQLGLRAKRDAVGPFIFRQRGDNDAAVDGLITDMQGHVVRDEGFAAFPVFVFQADALDDALQSYAAQSRKVGLQQFLRCAVHPEGLAILVQEQDAVPAALQRRVHHLSVVGLADLPLDADGRRLYHAERVRVRLANISGDVDAAHDFAVRPMDGRGGAGPAVVRDAVVLRPHHLDRDVIVQRHADGVGANLQIAPHGARHEAHVLRAGDDLLVPHHLQQIARAVGQHDEKAGSADDVKNLPHDGDGNLQKKLVCRPCALEHVCVDMPPLAPGGVEPRRPASAPGFGDRGPDLGAHLALKDVVRPERCHF